MNANQARDLMTTYMNYDKPRVFSLIKAEAERGRFFLTIEGDEWYKSFMLIERDFVELGYRVYGDRHYLCIDWNWK